MARAKVGRRGRSDGGRWCSAPLIAAMAILLAGSVACAATGGDTADSSGAADAEVYAQDGREVSAGAAARSGSVATGTPGGNRDDAPRRPTLLFIGTSITAGYGLEPSAAFPALVGQMLDSAGRPVEIVNAGVSGETSAGALRRLDWLLDTDADVIVVETGANDGLRGLDTGELRRNIQSILDRIREKQPRARVLLAQMESPPNMGPGYTTRFREIYSQVARTNGVELIPFLLDGVAGNPEMNQDDGIHPNLAGERVVARNVFAALTRDGGVQRLTERRTAR